MRKYGTAWIALAIAAATVVAYLPVLDNGFVNYDDDLYIVNNPHVNGGLDLRTVAWAFTSFRGANWFPLTWLSWAADFSLYGDDPAGFHLTSLMLHTANAVLLFLAFARLTGHRWRSALVAALFALHPLHVESVAWAAARKDVLSGFFAMLVLLAYERFTRRGWAFYPALLLSLGLGLMSKPTLVTWPFVLLLLDEWPLARLRDPRRPEGWDGSRLRRAVVEKLPLFALVAAFSGVALWSQSDWGTVQGFDRLPFSLRVANALDSYVAYGIDALWPVGLSVFYPHPGETLAAARVVAAAAVLAAISVAALALRRRHPEFPVGWFWYLGVLVPVIGLVQVGQAARADRYTYLPLIGLSLPLVWALAALAHRGRSLRAVVVAGVLIALTALGVATHTQASRWRSSLSLFRHALRVTERNHVAHINIGVALHKQGHDDLAAWHLERALEIAPASATAAGVLGDARLELGEPLVALREYRRALKREPDSLRWLEGVGNVMVELERFEEAARSYRRALRVGGASARVHANLGLALQHQELYDQAIESYESALRLNPSMAEVHGNLAVVLMETGQTGRAREHFERALEIDPGLALIHGYFAKLLAATGDLDGALRQLAEAVLLEPENGALYSAQARVFARLGRRDEALASYREAMSLGERSPATLVGLARLLLETGAASEAAALAEEAVEQTQRQLPAVLGLLGEAWAAAGRFDDAIRVTEEAAALAESRGSTGIAETLRARADAWRPESHR
jgi:tetratricopeptide (TPR) repeat protein